MSQTTDDRRYEPSDPPMRPVVAAGAMFVGAFVATCLIAAGIVLGLDAMDDRPRAADAPLSEQWRAQPAPALTVIQGVELRALDARAERWLSSYGWVDRDAGLVHIPIERAIELLAGQLADQPTDRPPVREGAP